MDSTNDTPSATYNDLDAYTSDLVKCPRCGAARGIDCRSLKNPARASSVVHRERVAARGALPPMPRRSSKA